MADNKLYLDKIRIEFIGNEISMPEDFFTPVEVVFRDINNNMYSSQEMTQEEFMRWQPNRLYSKAGEVFKLYQDNEPETLYGTVENFNYDGKIGYYFSIDKGKTILHWKPTFNGKIEILYSFIPDINILNESKPQFHSAFYNMLIYGTVIRALRRKFSKVQTEIELIALRNELTEYQKSFDEEFKNYYQYLKRGAETHQLDYWNFINDITMYISGS